MSTMESKTKKKFCHVCEIVKTTDDFYHHKAVCKKCYIQKQKNVYNPKPKGYTKRKCTDDQIIDIQNRCRNNTSIYQLAREYSISKDTISRYMKLDLQQSK